VQLPNGEQWALTDDLYRETFLTLPKSNLTIVQKRVLFRAALVQLSCIRGSQAWKQDGIQTSKPTRWVRPQLIAIQQKSLHDCLNESRVTISLNGLDLVMDTIAQTIVCAHGTAADSPQKRYNSGHKGHILTKKAFKRINTTATLLHAACPNASTKLHACCPVRSGASHVSLPYPMPAQRSLCTAIESPSALLLHSP